MGSPGDPTKPEPSTLPRDLSELESGLYHLAEKARRMRELACRPGSAVSAELRVSLDELASGIELQFHQARSARQHLAGQVPDFQPMAGSRQ